MKRPSIPVCIIVIVYLVVLLFMLIVPPTYATSFFGNGTAKNTTINYERLLMNILELTVVAVLAFFVLFLSRKLDSTPDRHSSTS